MGYEKKSINSIILGINSGKIFLPAIQRKYLWDDERITKLMDSIMRGYPIGTFLFWNVKKSIIREKEYSLYEFIRNFHERDNKENAPAPRPFPAGSDEETIWAVLDGQQRLTSLYIALQGTMSRKVPRKHWRNDDAFQSKQLYFDLHSKRNYDEEIKYEFKFLTDDEAENPKEDQLWYLVKDILQYSQKDLVKQVIVKNKWTEDDTAMDNIALLHTQLTSEENINYYKVDADSIDSVLDIFIRVNSGGMVLSKTDLLFSTIVSHWDKARDEIDSLLLEINRIGEGYKFTNDFIMRACLYVLDMSVTLKVETFKKDSIIKIKDNWTKIRAAIMDTVKLLNEFGFNAENIISYVAVIPIVYYRYKCSAFDESSKKELKKYFVMAQAKQIFGASTNSTLTIIRAALDASPSNSFKLSYLSNRKFSGGRNLRYTADEIDELVESCQVGSYAFLLLSLLYPNLKYDQKVFHQDHMHPHTSFEGEKLNGLILPDGSVIDDDIKEEWRHKRNNIANIQLLEGRENSIKKATPLEGWLKIPKNRENVKYLPTNVSYDLAHFETFISERQKLISKALKDILL